MAIDLDPHHQRRLAPVNPWPHRLAVLTAAATLLLIFVGGVVTNTGSGLAVPDWPTTFGYNMFLYPWSKMVGGILYEHSHRLLGSVVGLLTIGLAVSLWVADGRAWMHSLALIAVGAVIIQGVLGGMRVLLVDHPLAIVHGCLAHAFFALVVSLAVFTSPWWHETERTAPLLIDRSLRSFSIVTAAMVYLQIVVGALLTHLAGGWLHLHLLVAVAVIVHVVLLARRVLGQYVDRTELRRPVLSMLALTALQLALGLTMLAQRLGLTIPSTGAALLLATTHRITGALILAAGLVLVLRLAHLAAPRRVVAPSRPAPLSAAHSRQVTA